jgi:hypothetical protein
LPNFNVNIRTPALHYSESQSFNGSTTLLVSL